MLDLTIKSLNLDIQISAGLMLGNK